MFSSRDLEQIQQRGSDVSVVETQLENFKKGFPSLELKEAPKPGKGIVVLDDSEIKKLIEYYESKSQSIDILKFVPASGAASRMFKTLFAFLSEYDGSEESYAKLQSNNGKGSAFEFLKNIEDFAFYKELADKFQEINGSSMQEAHVKREYHKIVDALLSSNGLSYGSLPKGLLKFHNYGDNPRTPVEEHLVEGGNYAKGKNDVVKLHFTVSPEHLDGFKAHVNEVKGKYESMFSVTYDISYSIQKPSTDTIAVDLSNEPFRNDDESLLFRPAGHGALLENLNEQNADVVFVKNIDNVVPDHLKPTTYDYKKAIAGILLQTQERVFGYIGDLQDAISADKKSEIESFIFNELLITDDSYSSLSDDEQLTYLKGKLDRPIRVCGMVKNDGDPGGGPFFATNPDGSVSAQIAETAQIDLAESSQKDVFGQATHFNPVDLVCGLKNSSGEKFDLLQFRDMNTGFITEKSKDGKELKAMELPGLWNGAMSDWITIFMEVPLITFNPVKAVNDLLKKEHQQA